MYACICICIEIDILEDILWAYKWDIMGCTRYMVDFMLRDWKLTTRLTGEKISRISIRVFINRLDMILQLLQEKQDAPVGDSIPGMVFNRTQT